MKNNIVKPFLNKGGIIQSIATGNGVTVASNSKILPAHAVECRNTSHFITIEDAYVNCYRFTKDESRDKLLTKLTDSYGMQYLNGYSNMTENDNYINTSTSRYYPYFSVIAPINLLRTSDIYTDNYQAVRQYYYTWYGGVMHATGLGFCGFEKVKTIDYIQNITTEEERNPELFGVTTKVDSPFSTAYYYYYRNEGSNKKCNPQMTSSGETDKLTGVYNYVSYQYDTYNNPTKIMQNIGSGSGITRVTDQTYSNLVSSARYLVGQPLVKTVTSTRGGASWKDKEEITYNTDRLPATRITYTGTGGSDKTSETRWTYHTNGNITSEKSAPYNVTEFLGNTYTYDSSGRYVATVTNSLLQTAVYSNHDKYGNPKTVTDHKSRTITRAYNEWGQLTSVAYPDGTIATTKTTDASGTLVSVTDPGGTIAYALRPDGQPSSITAPGSVVTSFGYDAYGRRTSIVDPSAGTQTFNDVYTTAGVLTRTVKDANNKTVTSTYDKYGRVTGVGRPEFNTTYAYNTDGLLTSETSTNGTKVEYVEYDTYDRIKTVKETVPDSKWLQQVFTYSGGNVETVTYTSQSGLIGTETFVYANGHNTEIKLGATSIWKLTEENGLGQPTKATTGSMQRTYGYTAYGMPTGRTAGSIQSFTYDFDVMKGNLNSRKDNNRNITETFGYDNLNRLTNAAGKAIAYSSNGNITSIGGVGTLAYENTAKPYQISMFTPTGDAVPVREQSLSYTSFQRPTTLAENGYNTAFTYIAAGDRVKMHLTQGSTAVLTRYYIGGRYEMDTQINIERLYLAGDAYSAPAVYVKESGVWKIYYICRDYLGSITHVANADGSLKQELSYDAWGRLRNPATQVAYTPGSEPALFLGRGYTGHEHLPWFGLINMNARLYDAALGRFLSPDPYVQMPDFTQNFNRYSYCLNNPLIFTDITGEYFGVDDLIGALIGGVINLASNWKNLKGDNVWQTIGRGFAAFGAGTVGGVGSLYPQFGGWAWGGATVGATNAWLGGAKGWGIALGGGIGIVSGMAGGAAGQYGGKYIGGIIVNGTKIASPVVQSTITGSIGGAAGGYAGGFTAGLIMSGDIGQANQMGLEGLKSGAVVGSVVGAGAGYKYAIDNKISPWTGKPLNTNSTAQLQSSQPQYDFTPNPDGDNVTLYRGTTGSEGKGGPLFMTDSPEYAATYVKNGGEVVKVTMPRSTYLEMQRNMHIQTYRGMHGGMSGLEYKIDPSVVPYILKLFK